ncbi:MAG: hypothetical protein RIB45_00680 [Marivibrio sp.]|uniref:hypothetical protein n=1 Tax=Marivibrio sp. TaxID=2039719 RepID=UPI0032F049E9
MALMFPYEVYALRVGAAAPVYALLSPVRLALAAFGPTPPPFGRDLANALRALDASPGEVQDIILIGPAPAGGPKTVAAFADAWIHRVSAEKDLLAGVSAIYDAHGELTLSIATRRGRLVLPRPEAAPPGATLRLD